MAVGGIPLFSVWQSNECEHRHGGRIRRCEVVGFPDGRKVALRNLEPPHRTTRVDRRFFGLLTVKGWRRIEGVTVRDGVMVPE